jgi:hypothetical protein
LARITIDARLPLGEILANLEERIAHLRAQEAEHGEREAFHGERRAACAAELAKVTEHYEALRQNLAAVAVMGLLSLPASPGELPLGKKPTINLAVREVIARLRPHRPFGPREITEEVNRLYADRLGGPVKARQVSVSLRWMARTKRIHQVLVGTSHQGSQYVRELPEAATRPASAGPA